MQRRTILVRAGIFAIAWALCLGPAQAQRPVTLTLGSTGLLYIPIYTADLMKQWDAVGTPVEVLYINSGSRLAAALVSGDSDVTVQSITPSFLAREKGQDTECVGAVINQMASNLVVSKSWAAAHHITAATPYAEKLAALKGARIGITSPGSGSDAVARYLVGQAGLNPDRDVTIVSIGDTNSMVPALFNNSIDALTSSPPIPDIAVKKFGAVTLLDLVGGEVKSLDGFMYQGVLVKQSYATGHRSQVIGVLRGLQRALDVIHDPARTNTARDLVWKANYKNTDKTLFDNVWKAMEPAFPKTVELTQAKIDQVLEFERAGGANISVKVAQSGWTNDLAAEAVRMEKQK